MDWKEFFTWQAIATALGIAAPAGLIILLIVDYVLDSLREKNEALQTPGWVAFDRFVDGVRKVIGSGTLSVITEKSIVNMACLFYDKMDGIGVPMSEAFTREEFVAKVLAWYQEQVNVEAISLSVYIQAVPHETRAMVAQNKVEPRRG